MMCSDTIHIALAPWDLSDDYNRHCGVTMVSILENTSSPVVFHLLHDECLSELNREKANENISKYYDIVKKYGASIEFVNVSVPDWIINLPSVKYYTIGTLLRFHIPELLPSLDKIIYLDSDIVVLANIAELWSLPLNNMSLGARLGNPNKMTWSRKRYYKSVGLNPNKYFNAGMLIMNLYKIRESFTSFSNSAYTCLKSHPQFGNGWLDQDVFNFLFLDDFLILDDKWNYLSNGVMDNSDYSDYILHFAGRNKPWNIIYCGVDLYYWKYLLMSPWGSDVNKVFQYSLEAPNELTAINRLPEWIFYSSPKEQLHKLWLIIRGVIWTVIVFDVKYIYYCMIRGKNYAPKKK